LVLLEFKEKIQTQNPSFSGPKLSNFIGISEGLETADFCLHGLYKMNRLKTPAGGFNQLPESA